MIGSGGIDRRRVRVIGGRAACVVRALAEAQGLLVVEGDAAAEVSVAEIETGEDLRARVAEGLPLVAVVGRRLREGEAKQLRDAGARAVIDAESSLLDVAFVLSDHLFSTRQEQRRHTRAYGGMQVRLRSLDRAEPTSGPRAREAGTVDGVLADLARPGAFVVTGARLPEGQPVELELDILDRPVRLLGRVAFATTLDGRGGVAVEFELGHGDVAPKLFALCDQAALARGERRARSGLRAALSSVR